MFEKPRLTRACRSRDLYESPPSTSTLRRRHVEYIAPILRRTVRALWDRRIVGVGLFYFPNIRLILPVVSPVAARQKGPVSNSNLAHTSLGFGCARCRDWQLRHPKLPSRNPCLSLADSRAFVITHRRSRLPFLPDRLLYKRFIEIEYSIDTIVLSNPLRRSGIPAPCGQLLS